MSCDCHENAAELTASSSGPEETEGRRLLLGRHVSFEKDFYTTINQAVKNNYFVIQFECPRSAFGQKTAKFIDKDIRVFSHCSMTCLPSGYLDGRPFRLYKPLADELDTFGSVNGSCVCHIGYSKKRLEGLQKTAENVVKTFGLTKGTGKLLLENSGKGGNSLGQSFDELYELNALVDNSQLGFCLDTQHCFAQGMSLETSEGVAEFLQKTNEIPVGLIHLNDSLVEKGSKKDRHAAIGTTIWSQGLSSLKMLLDALETKNLPFTLETPDPDNDLKIIRAVKEL